MVKLFSYLAVSLLLIGNTGELAAIEPNGLLNMTQIEKKTIIEGVDTELENLLEILQKIIGTTSQIQVLDLQYEENHLFIDFSEALTSYGGGNEVEHQVIRTIKEWAFENKSLTELTVLVEGSVEGFPEGTIVKGETIDSNEE